jgi:mono/diheme cytochrome c family protein
VRLLVLLAATALAASAAAAELRGPAEFDSIADEGERSRALFTEMGKVLTHPRCVNCHPAGDSPLQRAGEPHQPPVERGPAGFGVTAMRCMTCHGAENVAFYTEEGSIPGHAPWQLAPIEMAWEGKSLAEICRQIQDPERNGGKTLAELVEHNAHDGLVGWGWEPGEGREPAPGSQMTFGELTAAWVATGARCPGE